MSNTYKLGSLFDGSGGFPLAGSLCGIVPAWASEVEPYPIAVTRSRFPGMKHLGDISKINGADIEPVNVITFGSPCQDLSVAGKRAGIKHEATGDEETTRSGLFMEAVRIIKEMRAATNGIYPNVILWENVPGAFSSNGGEDFRTVLDELIKIVEPDAAMPPVPKAGWAYADSYCGDGWSLAYRVFDAQYWGVPQRRRRIHLIVDFGGERAGEILFERDGLRGYFAESGAQGKGTSPDVEGGTGADDRAGKGGCIAFHLLQDPIPSSKVYPCMGQGNSDGGQASIGVAYCTEKIICMATQQGGAEIRTDDKAPTVTAAAGMSGNNQPVVCYAAGFKANQGSKAGGIGFQDECAPCLSSGHHGLEPTVVCKEQYLFENHSQDTRYKGPLDVCPMLPAQLGTGGNNTPFVVERGIGPCCYNGENITSPLNKTNPRPGDPCHTLGTDSRNYLVVPVVCYESEKGTFQNTGAGWWNESPIGATVRTPCGGDAVMANVVVEKADGIIVFDKEVYNSGKNAAGGHYIVENGPAPSIRTEHPPGVCVRYIVRRLTPTECARLQGFADRWGDIDPKEDFTDEEYRFWLEVRNTHAAINGKTAKEYTREQMLKWYNKLHTDSGEYKMWGNGIALPPALYCMQGIVDALEEETK